MGSSTHGCSYSNSNRSSCSGCHLEGLNAWRCDMTAFPNVSGHFRTSLGFMNSIGLEGHGVDMPSCTCYLACLCVSKVKLPLLTSWKWYLLKDSDLGRMPGMWCTSICLSPTFSLCWILLWALAWFTLAYRYYFSGIVFCQTLPKEASRSKEISYNSGEHPSLNKNEWTNHNHLMNYSD